MPVPFSTESIPIQSTWDFVTSFDSHRIHGQFAHLLTIRNVSGLYCAPAPSPAARIASAGLGKLFQREGKGVQASALSPRVHGPDHCTVMGRTRMEP